ncbi:hypothetical protein LIER_41028 [Lithospermum erythrorhizon]|uniref:Trichome birefringence-like C-terminal domain-containing protein n=1 Tax=Lithospermum erythrorhizon TaxID=34254 RepID=A0AAV3R764_LITER
MLLNPETNRGKDWSSTTNNCQGEKQPLKGSSYPTGLPKEVKIIKRVLRGMKTKVYLLDTTTLSQLRKDAHPSVYSATRSGNDCSHWCLPGLPFARYLEPTSVYSLYLTLSKIEICNRATTL